MRTYWRTTALAVCSAVLLLGSVGCGQQTAAAPSQPSQTQGERI